MDVLKTFSEDEPSDKKPLDGLSSALLGILKPEKASEALEQLELPPATKNNDDQPEKTLLEKKRIRPGVERILRNIIRLKEAWKLTRSALEKLERIRELYKEDDILTSLAETILETAPNLEAVVDKFVQESLTRQTPPVLPTLPEDFYGGKETLASTMNVLINRAGLIILQRRSDTNGSIDLTKEETDYVANLRNLVNQCHQVPGVSIDMNPLDRCLGKIDELKKAELRVRKANEKAFTFLNVNEIIDFVENEILPLYSAIEELIPGLAKDSIRLTLVSLHEDTLKEGVLMVRQGEERIETPSLAERIAALEILSRLFDLNERRENNEELKGLIFEAYSLCLNKAIEFLENSSNKAEPNFFQRASDLIDQLNILLNTTDKMPDASARETASSQIIEFYIKFIERKVNSIFPESEGELRVEGIAQVCTHTNYFSQFNAELCNKKMRQAGDKLISEAYQKWAEGILINIEDIIALSPINEQSAKQDDAKTVVSEHLPKLCEMNDQLPDNVYSKQSIRERICGIYKSYFSRCLESLEDRESSLVAGGNLAPLMRIELDDLISLLREVSKIGVIDDLSGRIGELRSKLETKQFAPIPEPEPNLEPSPWDANDPLAAAQKVSRFPKLEEWATAPEAEAALLRVAEAMKGMEALDEETVDYLCNLGQLIEQWESGVDNSKLNVPEALRATITHAQSIGFRVATDAMSEAEGALNKIEKELDALETELNETYIQPNRPIAQDRKVKIEGELDGHQTTLNGLNGSDEIDPEVKRLNDKITSLSQKLDGIPAVSIAVRLANTVNVGSKHEKSEAETQLEEIEKELADPAPMNAERIEQLLNLIEKYRWVEDLKGRIEHINICLRARLLVVLGNARWKFNAGILDTKALYQILEKVNALNESMPLSYLFVSSLPLTEADAQVQGFYENIKNQVQALLEEIKRLEEKAKDSRIDNEYELEVDSIRNALNAEDVLQLDHLEAVQKRIEDLRELKANEETIKALYTKLFEKFTQLLNSMDNDPNMWIGEKNLGKVNEELNQLTALHEQIVRIIRKADNVAKIEESKEKLQRVESEMGRIARERNEFEKAKTTPMQPDQPTVPDGGSPSFGEAITRSREEGPGSADADTRVEPTGAEEPVAPDTPTKVDQQPEAEIPAPDAANTETRVDQAASAPTANDQPAKVPEKKLDTVFPIKPENLNHPQNAVQDLIEVYQTLVREEISISQIDRSHLEHAWRSMKALWTRPGAPDAMQWIACISKMQQGGYYLPPEAAHPLQYADPVVAECELERLSKDIKAGRASAPTLEKCKQLWSIYTGRQDPASQMIKKRLTEMWPHDSKSTPTAAQ